MAVILFWAVSIFLLSIISLEGQIFIKAPEFKAEDSVGEGDHRVHVLTLTWKNRGTHAQRKLLIKLMRRMSVDSHPHTHTH